MLAFSSRLRALASLGLVVLFGCGDDSVVNPTFGARCSAGALAPGQAVNGTLNESSCFIDYNFWSSETTPYESYSVTLEKGKGYYFHMQVRPDADGLNDVDPLLVLYGKNADGASVPLAVSDDDADGATGYDSEFYFIAPQSGTFQLVTFSYGQDYGGYRVSMERCPVGGTLDTAGTYTGFELTFSGCIRRSTDDGGHTSPMVLLSVPVTRGESVTALVESPDFDEVYEMGGPGFDVYNNIYDGHQYFSGQTGSVLTFPNIQVAGNYTLAVASDAFSSVGRFSVTLTRTPGVTLMDAPAAMATMKSSFGPRVPKRR